MFTAPLVTMIGLVRSTSPLIDRLIRFWARSIVHAAGLELSADNFQQMDPDKRYILVANHNSYLDIPCLLVTVPQPLRFMAKISLFKIPLFGWGLKAAGFIPIDRKNRKTAVKSFDLAATRIRKGNSIVIFPEEGRSRTREMRPFQRGAFLLALKSELPLLPVAIEGTYDALPVGANRVQPGKVRIVAGEPIDCATFSIKMKGDLMEQTRARILELQEKARS